MSQQPSRRDTLIALTSVALPTAGVAQQGAPITGDPLTIELSGVALPVVKNGILINYLFGVINIQMGDAGAVLFLRENSFLLRDAIIKIASRAPIPAGALPKTFDRVAVTRVVFQAIQAIRPNARVIRVTVQDAAFMRN